MAGPYSMLARLRVLIALMESAWTLDVAAEGRA
jgi:hypothetical protein